MSLTVAGCSAPAPSKTEDAILNPIVTDSGDAIVVDVDEAHPLAVEVAGLGRITAPSHAFSSVGQIVVQPLKSKTGDGAAITTDGPGFDLSLRGTTIVSPLTIYFDDPAIAKELPSGAIPVVAHLPTGGHWETKQIELTPDGVPYLITDEFSPNLFGWFALPDWLTSLPAKFDQWATTSYPQRECVGGGPSWATVSDLSDLIHTCLISNTDASSGAVRAEVQIQSNRKRFQWVRIPSGYDYVWVDGQPSEVRSAIAALSGKSQSSYVLLWPGQWMSVGYRQPAEGQETRDLEFQVSGDDQTNGLNFLAGLLEVAVGEAPNSGGWASLLVVAVQCRDSLTDFGALAICVAEQAVGGLKDPTKAVAAARSVLGNGYGEAFVSQWTKVATKLHALGIVVSLLSVIGWFHRTVVELFDGVVGVDNLALSQVHLRMVAPAPPAPAPPSVPPAPPGPVAPGPAPAPPSTSWSVSLTRSGDTITYHWKNMPPGMWSQVDRFRCWRYTEQTHPHGWATDGCGEQTGYAGFPVGTGQVSFTYAGATNAFSVEPWKYGPWLNVGESCGGDSGGNNC
jgi:hypothetical protein